MIRTSVAAVSLIFAVSASGQPKSNSVAQPAMTVADAIAIGTALRQVGDYQEGGKTVSVSFRFEGPVLMTMAVDIAISDQVRKNYQDAYNALIRQVSGGKDRVPEDKMPDFNAQLDKLASAPSSAKFERIKQAQLCLASPPQPPCQVTNAIPPAVLAALLPIIER